MANAKSNTSLSDLQAELIDLTDDVSAPSKDHMSTIAQMIRQDSTEHLKAPRQSSPRKHAKLGSSSTNARIPSSFSTSRSGVFPGGDFQASFDENGDSIQQHNPLEPIDISDTERAGVTTSNIGNKQAKKDRELCFHRFLDLPAELRNNIYRLLLATPGTPVELPKLTGVEGRRPTAAWAK